MDLLKNKTALITGGNDGIGYAIAEAFARHGADLIIVGRNLKKLTSAKEALSKYNRTVLTIPADISNQESIYELAEQVHSQKMKVDILVNNAGIARFISFKNTDISMLDYHIALNVKAPYLLTQAFIDDLVDSGGNVINISSYFAKRMLPDRPSTAYSLSKGAVESFTKALAFEFGSRGVRVNAIAPGTVTTQQVQLNYEQLDDKAKERFNSMVKTIYPLQRTGKPEHIAETAVFIASDNAEWITGAIFPVDGGLTTN